MKFAPVYALLLLFVFCTSCGGQNKTDPPKENIKPQSKDIVTSPGSNEPDIPSKYEYADSIGKRLVIQNSFPKGGIKYTDSNGEVYVYAVFWTRIINETDNPFNHSVFFDNWTDILSNRPKKGGYESHRKQRTLHL